MAGGVDANSNIRKSGQFLWQPSLPRKVHTDVYFLEKTQKDPRYGTGVYLEKCQSRNGLLFISENVKVNGVYFDPKKSTHTGHTVHTGHYTLTIS